MSRSAILHLSSFTLTDDVSATGDIRNVVETIANLPQSYDKLISIAINDRDMDIVARNLIITLIVFQAPSDLEAIDGMVHVWYSAKITAKHADLLRTHIRALISDIVGKTAGKAPNTLLGKTWSFPQGTVRVELEKWQWDAFLAYFDVPSGLTSTRADEIRREITMAPSRQDQRHRHMCAEKPAHRLCPMKYREDGILLPFGASRGDFIAPNP